MLEKVEILKDSNEKITVDLVSAFKMPVGDIEKSYAIVTINELDQNGLIKLLVCELATNKLIKISDEKEWSNVKNVMRSIISSSSYDYSYILVPNKLTASNDFFRIIAVQDAAKTQLISDYLTKKPKEEVGGESVVPEVSELENPAIYPKENPEVKIGSEVVPGIVENNPVDIQVNSKEEPVEVKIEDTLPQVETNISDIPGVMDAPAIDVDKIFETNSTTNDIKIEESASNANIVQPIQLENQVPVENNVVQNNPVEIENSIQDSNDNVVPIDNELKIENEVNNNQPQAQNEVENNPVEEPKNIVQNNSIVDAEKILKDKINAAVEEYLRTIREQNVNEEINKLKKEIEEKNKKIEEIKNMLK